MPAFGQVNTPGAGRVQVFAAVLPAGLVGPVAELIPPLGPRLEAAISGPYVQLAQLRGVVLDNQRRFGKLIGQAVRLVGGAKVMEVPQAHIRRDRQHARPAR